MTRDLLVSLGLCGPTEPPKEAVLRLHAEHRRALSLLAAWSADGDRVSTATAVETREVLDAAAHRPLHIRATPGEKLDAVWQETPDGYSVTVYHGSATTVRPTIGRVGVPRG